MLFELPIILLAILSKFTYYSLKIIPGFCAKPSMLVRVFT